MTDLGKAFIGIACRDDVHVTMMAKLLEFGGDAEHFAFIRGFCVEDIRNKMVKQFLAMKECDWLLMIDADNTPTRNPLELREHDKDIMVCPTPIHLPSESLAGTRLMWNCFNWSEKEETFKVCMENKGLQRIAAGGTGCMLVHRRVFEHEHMRAPFQRQYDADGCQAMGSDLWFCKRAGNHGFETWAHYDYPCHHYKTMDLLGVMQVMAARDISHANKPNINTAEYWDEQWGQRFTRTYPYYQQIAEMCSDQIVLDYGCGIGGLLELLDKSARSAEGQDISMVAVAKCHEKGLKASLVEPNEVRGHWDTIVATELLEHVDNDQELLRKFFEHADQVIFAVPNNCLPPGVEPEHRRVYTMEYIDRLMPHPYEAFDYGRYLLVSCRKP